MYLSIIYVTFYLNLLGPGWYEYFAANTDVKGVGKTDSR